MDTGDRLRHPAVDEHPAEHPTIASYVAVYIALLVLLVVTVGAAQLQAGRWALPIAMLIATSKAVLILLFFMHLRYSTPLIWLVAAAGFLFLAILLGFSFSDYFTRLMIRPA
jgi:cytochrome c oxidase subunit 4